MTERKKGEVEIIPPNRSKDDQLPATNANPDHLPRPELPGKNPFRNLLDRMHTRDQKNTLDDYAERERSYIEYLKVWRELHETAQETSRAVESFKHNTAKLIAADQAALDHELAQSDRQRQVEAHRLQRELDDLNGDLDRGQRQRMLEAEANIARLEAEKAEAQRSFARTSDDALQRARINAEIKTLENGDFKKLGELYANNRLSQVRSGAAAGIDPDDEASKLEVEIIVLQKKQDRELDSDSPNQAAIAWLAAEIRKLRREQEKAEAARKAVP